MNRNFLVFTFCILSRQTVKYISALILFVAQLLFQCWLCKTQKAVACLLNVVVNLYYILYFCFPSICQLKILRNKKCSLARNPEALVYLSTVMCRWEESRVVTCPRQIYREFYRTWPFQREKGILWVST